MPQESYISPSFDNSLAEVEFTLNSGRANSALMVERVAFRDKFGDRSFLVDVSAPQDAQAASRISARDLRLLALAATGADTPTLTQLFNEVESGDGIISATMNERLRQTCVRLGSITRPRQNAIGASIWNAFQKGFFRPELRIPTSNLPTPVRDDLSEINLYYELCATRGILYEPGYRIIDGLCLEGIVDSPIDLAILTRLVDVPECEIATTGVNVLPNDLTMAGVIRNVMHQRQWTALANEPNRGS